MSTFDVGPVSITYRGTERHRGETPSGQVETGDFYLFDGVDGEHGAAMTLGYIDWAGPEREVKLLEVDRGPSELHHLRGLRRLTVQSDGEHEYVELRQLRLQLEGATPWSTLRKVPELELDEGAGVNVGGVLSTAGALGMGPRADLLSNDDSNRGSYLCATFEPDNRKVPIAAFTLTRVLPALNGVEDS